MQYTTDRKWIGGSKAETVATDAKNASPISAVAVGLNGTQYVRCSGMLSADIVLTVI
jgi:hypothetical protein